MLSERMLRAKIRDLMAAGIFLLSRVDATTSFDDLESVSGCFLCVGHLPPR